MASASATSWSFAESSRPGCVTVRRENRVVKVRLQRKEVAAINILTGKGKVRLRHNLFLPDETEPPSIQLMNTFNRMFSQLGAERYSTHIRAGQAYLEDSIKKTKVQITGDGVPFVLPTKCIVKLIGDMVIYPMELLSWLQDVENEARLAIQDPQAAVEHVPF